MNDFSTLQPSSRGLFRSLSMGVKLILVCLLALLMAIPAFFVSGLVDDRTQRAKDVVQEISSHVGGPQTFLGPTLAVPYSIPSQSPADTKHGIYFVFPAQASAFLRTKTEERHRSLFRVPVFQADVKLDANFDLAGVPAAAPQGAELDWSRAEIVIGVSDPRGALADATLTTDGKTITLTPAEVAEKITFGNDQNGHIKLSLVGTNLGNIARPGVQFHATSTLSFSGAERIAVLAYGKTTHLAAEGDWRNHRRVVSTLPCSRRTCRRARSVDYRSRYNGVGYFIH
jgi:inner membrane protein